MATAETYDVFISYAHADNGVALGASSPVGWVTALATNLNEGPNVLRKRIFIDHQLKPGDQFSDDLLTIVARSRVLVILLSQNYVDSSWCGKEIEHFVRTRANNTDQPTDVFVVEIFPFESLLAVPSVILELRKHLIHAKFWLQPTTAASPVLSGYPSPKDSGDEVAAHYWRVLNELRVAVDTRLRCLRASAPAASEMVTAAPSAAPRNEKSGAEPWATLLLADTTEDLEPQRTAVRMALEPEGVVVLPAGDYVGLSADEFAAAIRADSARSQLFVQLLSPTAGRKGRGFSAPLPQLQFQQAQLARLPIMQWCEHQPAADQIADPAHAQLFATEHLRVTNLTAFTREVIARLRADQARRRQAAATPESPGAARTGRKLVFVDDLASSGDLGGRLRALIRAQHFDLRSLPPTAPLGNDGIDVKELLRPCRAGLTIYADRSKYATAYNRLVYFLNQVAEYDLEVERWGVYLEQGTVASEFGIESDDVVAVNEQGLCDFLRGL